MARMVPTPMLPVQSPAEARLYEALRDQLPDEFTCYHGITWLRMAHRPEEGEADFLIAHPHHGVLVLEVKGGPIVYDPATRTWRRGTKTVKQDPFDQARDSMHWLMDELKLNPGASRYLPTFGYGVAFPDGEYTTQAHPNAPLDLVADRRDMDDLERRITRLMERWHGGRPRDFGADGMRALDETLGYRVEVLVPLGRIVGEAVRKDVALTPEQAYVTDMLRRMPRAAVTGAAGSGKTLIAIEVARRLSKEGKRTLLTCFNKRLATYLADATADLQGVTAVHLPRARMWEAAMVRKAFVSQAGHPLLELRFRRSHTPGNGFELSSPLEREPETRRCPRGVTRHPGTRQARLCARAGQEARI